MVDFILELMLTNTHGLLAAKGRELRHSTGVNHKSAESSLKGGTDHKGTRWKKATVSAKLSLY